MLMRVHTKAVGAAVVFSSDSAHSLHGLLWALLGWRIRTSTDTFELLQHAQFHAGQEKGVAGDGRGREMGVVRRRPLRLSYFT